MQGFLHTYSYPFADVSWSVSGPLTVSSEESLKARFMTLSMGYQNRALLDMPVRPGDPIRERKSKKKGGGGGDKPCQ